MAHYIKKSSGKRERFSIKKFKRSLKKVGAPSGLIEKIVSEILERPELDTTHKIYAYAYKRLKRVDRPVAARYSLKYALYDLGPEGFLFERFVGELFKAQGYKVKIGLVISGYCVDHEVDNIIEKEQRFMVECKFHNRRGLKTDVKVALYIKARFLDLSQEWKRSEKPRLVCDGVWLVTNTQFTSEAIKYGTCAGINLLGWAYPEQGNIAQLIDTLGLHPITSLTCLSKAQKRKLLERNILLCRDILKQPDVMKEFGFTPLKLQKIDDECKALCVNH